MTLFGFSSSLLCAFSIVLLVTWKMFNLQKLRWVEGQDFSFDDTLMHSAVNRRGGERVILWLDLPRQDLPWRLYLVNRLIIRVAGKVHPMLRQMIKD